MFALYNFFFLNTVANRSMAEMWIFACNTDKKPAKRMEENMMMISLKEMKERNKNDLSCFVGDIKWIAEKSKIIANIDDNRNAKRRMKEMYRVDVTIETYTQLIIHHKQTKNTCLFRQFDEVSFLDTHFAIYNFCHNNNNNNNNYY